MNKWDLDACIHCGKCTRSCLFLEKYGIDLPVLKEKPELGISLFLVWNLRVCLSKRN